MTSTLACARIAGALAPQGGEPAPWWFIVVSFTRALCASHPLWVGGPPSRTAVQPCAHAACT